ncbi:MAG: hypothetical protein RsTaC01_0154 [Candidatus Paraimprobicoccus trichonymphae]|uniref:Uncharacterized protein n=1 Tax=Candidatus Paraimprobicoccus trichonymphae TaxID=3033793 RepID=A0AA48HVX6_9FIRM|nr:MAG: hypothetical protein RsTaC01_0154 [Candidatus Paraimprobicoccus trichonymphae]
MKNLKRSMTKRKFTSFIKILKIGWSKEEFAEHLSNIIKLFENFKEIDETELSKIVGGKMNDLNKTVALMLGTLTLATSANLRISATDTTQQSTKATVTQIATKENSKHITLNEVAKGVGYTVAVLLAVVLKIGYDALSGK